LSSPCPLYDKLLNELNQSPEIQAMIARNKDLFAYLTEKSGRNVTTFEDVEFLYDVLFIEVVREMGVSHYRPLFVVSLMTVFIRTDPVQHDAT
jgi:hypothetical protein